MTGIALRQLRESLSLSQREFGEILGVTRVTITNAENKKPSRQLIAYIDVALAQGRLKRSERSIETPTTKAKPTERKSKRKSR
jgi:transcriptional regulator with XRE-family HTH domain